MRRYSREIPNPNLVKPKGLGVRHIQTVMLALGLGLSYMMRVNMSLAIVVMTTGPDKFDWDIQIQSMILSSFTWGYFILQIPAGIMASSYGKILIIFSIGLNAFISLILPFGARGGWQIVCACRIIQGLSQGLLFPSTHTMIGKWIPIEEKGCLGVIIYAGTQLGIAFEYITGGYIANYLGWQYIFYVNGILGVVWLIAYVVLGANSPETSRFINEPELKYIQTSLGHLEEPKKLKTPWKSLFKSVPFLTLILCHSGHAWGFWTLITEIPSYFAKVTHVDIKKNGILSALPYVSIYLFSFPVGCLADMCIEKKWLSITATRKVFNTMGFWGPAAFLVGLSYSPTGNVTAAVLMLCLVVALNAGHYAGYMLVHIDMAPNFAGQMMGITNSIANFVAIFAPLAAGQVLVDDTSADDWRKVFYMSTGIYFFSNALFLWLGTSKLQIWNDVDEEYTFPRTSEEMPQLALDLN